MSETRFTPGPWVSCSSTERGAECGRVHVGHIDETGTVRLLPKTYHNAVLQAAAPELYEALEAMLALHTVPAGATPEIIQDKTKFREFLKRTNRAIDAAVAKARAALGRARGES